MTPIYATAEEVKAYTTLVARLDDDAIEAEITNAEQDIDFFIPPGDLLENGRRYDPADEDTPLSEFEIACLMRATCAQVEYRLHMGPAIFIEGRGTVKGPDSESKNVPMMAPKARHQLLQASFIRLTGRMT